MTVRATRGDSPSLPPSVPGTRTLALPLFLVLGALSAFGPLSMDLYLPALPQLTEDVGSTEAVGQLTMSACMIGLALGQLLFGPISDRYGRRCPLLIGVAVFAVTSFACAMATSIELLIALRLVQGLAGGAGIVIARAVVRDLCDTVAAARVFSLLMLVTGVAPVLAPVLGAQVLRFTEWPGTFIALGLIGAVLLLAGAWGLPESLPPQRRAQAGLRVTGAQLTIVLRDRVFVGYTTVLALGSVLLFAYIVMSPFVLQDEFELSPQAFSLVFALNSLGIVIGGSISASLVRRFGPRRTLIVGLGTGAAGAVALTTGAVLDAGLPVLLPLLFLTVSTVALVMPTSTAMALSGQGARAGTASGVVGLAQFGVGGAVAPLVSSTGATAVLMTGTMAVSALAALVLLSRLPRIQPRTDAPTAPPTAATDPGVVRP